MERDEIAFDELEHERDLLRDVALRLWTEVEFPEQHRELAIGLGFVLSMTGDRELHERAAQ